jgi:hypothetical protein
LDGNGGGVAWHCAGAEEVEVVGVEDEDATVAYRPRRPETAGREEEAYRR